MSTFTWVTTTSDYPDIIQHSTYELPPEVAVWLMGRIPLMNRPGAPTIAEFSSPGSREPATRQTMAAIHDFLMALQVFSEEQKRDGGVV